MGKTSLRPTSCCYSSCPCHRCCCTRCCCCPSCCYCSSSCCWPSHWRWCYRTCCWLWCCFRRGSFGRRFYCRLVIPYFVCVIVIEYLSITKLAGRFVKLLGSPNVRIYTVLSKL